MKLKPLEQWICDTCGQVIEKPEDGYVQFGNQENGFYKDFIIVHHFSASPRREYNDKGCYQYNSDSDLIHYLGENGIAALLSQIDHGRHFGNSDETCIKNLSETNWIDFFRRLQTPYYEEARIYWAEAESDGFFGGANEIWPYMPEHLKILIQRYGK